MAKRHWRILGVALAAMLAACAPSPPPSQGPTADPSLGPPVSAFDQQFHEEAGPSFAPDPPPVGPDPSISGITLSLDRRTVTVGFIGGRPYRSDDPCTQDYQPWAKLAGDRLQVAIGVLRHPEQATFAPNSGCTLEGKSYLVRLHLGAAFAGAEIEVLGAGTFALPSPDDVAEIRALPPGWIQTSLGTDGKDGNAQELNRSYAPDPSVELVRNASLTLLQSIGGELRPIEGTVAARVLVGAQFVDIYDDGAGYFKAEWNIETGPVALAGGYPGITLSDFEALVRSVGVPAR